MDGKSCLGTYQPEGQCLSCALALWCIDVTIKMDGYYDSLAEREEQLWEYEDQLLVDAAIRDAELR